MVVVLVHVVVVPVGPDSLAALPGMDESNFRGPCSCWVTSDPGSASANNTISQHTKTKARKLEGLKFLKT